MGVAPAGATTYKSVTVGAVEPLRVAPLTVSSNAMRSAADKRVQVEAVVCLAEQSNIDLRPEELRRRLAIRRYTEQGAEDRSRRRDGFA